MYPRLIKSAAVLAAVSLCAAAASLYWVYRSGHAHLIGSLVFAETVRPESKIKEIVIRSPEYTLILIWCVRCSKTSGKHALSANKRQRRSSCPNLIWAIRIGVTPMRAPA